MFLHMVKAKVSLSGELKVVAKCKYQGGGCPWGSWEAGRELVMQRLAGHARGFGLYRKRHRTFWKMVTWYDWLKCKRPPLAQVFPHLVPKCGHCFGRLYNLYERDWEKLVVRGKPWGCIGQPCFLCSSYFLTVDVTSCLTVCSHGFPTMTDYIPLNYKPKEVLPFKYLSQNWER